MSESPLFLVRIAGLPGSAMDEIGIPDCDEAVECARTLQRELGEARARLVDELYRLTPQAPPDLRRFLLAVKRDAFNGRSLDRHAKMEGWPRLLELAGAALPRVLDLEVRLAAADERIEKLYRDGEERERAALARHLGNRKLLRGIALASQDLVEELPRRLGNHQGTGGRKERKAERSLLRYISRAALKLSPYSTLTPIGLGTVCDAPLPSLRLVGEKWQESSLFRAKRYLLDQYREILLRYPPIRKDLEVELNDTLEEMSPGNFRLLRPTVLARDEESGEFQYVPASMVRTQLNGPLVAWLLENLAGRSMKYRALVEALSSDLARDEDAAELALRVEATVEKLLAIGFLKLLPPWPSHEIHLEKRMLEILSRFQDDELLAPVRDGLTRLVELEAGYRTAERPAESIRQLDGLAEEIWNGLAPLGIPDAQLGFTRSRSWNYYEDVFLRSDSPDSRQGEIFHLSKRTADEIFRSADLLWRISSPYQSRYELQHALAALARETWPGRKEVGFLDLFAAAQPLWKSYIAAKRQDRKVPFNPYGLQEVERLKDLRDGIQDALRRTAFLDENGYHVSPGTAEEILSTLPECYDPIVGSCVFVQPLDRAGRSWMLNRLFEGTGRYGSRFTAGMDEDIRQRYVAQFTEAARLEPSGSELLDLLFSQGNTVNIHWLQTPRVLEIPGERADLPAERRLSPRDLRVQLDTPTGLPWLTDRFGKRCLPCHMSALNSIYTPVLLKFLALFGPFIDAGAAVPLPEERSEGGVTVKDRVTFGNLVVRRKRWIAATESFPGRGLSAAGAYKEINAWRLAQGLPPQVFLIELTETDLAGRKVWKPQYLDFTSPTFLAILMASLDASEGFVTFEEVLPSRDLYPADSQGRRWGVELLLDSLVLPRRNANLDASCSGSSHLREIALPTLESRPLSRKENPHEREEDRRSGQHRQR